MANAATRAVVARAYYTVDPLRLERFCTILRNGGYLPEEAIVFQLREYITKHGCRTMIEAREVYARTEYALLRFLDGQKVARLYAVERESFLLPEEKTEGNLNR